MIRFITIVCFLLDPNISFHFPCSEIGLLWSDQPLITKNVKISITDSDHNLFYK